MNRLLTRIWQLPVLSHGKYRLRFFFPLFLSNPKQRFLVRSLATKVAGKLAYHQDKEIEAGRWSKARLLTSLLRVHMRIHIPTSSRAVRWRRVRQLESRLRV